MRSTRHIHSIETYVLLSDSYTYNFVVVAHAWQDPVHHTARRTGFSWQNRSSTPNFSELSAFARFLRCPGLWFESTAKTKDALPLLLLFFFPIILHQVLLLRQRKITPYKISHMARGVLYLSLSSLFHDVSPCVTYHHWYLI